MLSEASKLERNDSFTVEPAADSNAARPVEFNVNELYPAVLHELKLIPVAYAVEPTALKSDVASVEVDACDPEYGANEPPAPDPPPATPYKFNVAAVTVAPEGNPDSENEKNDRKMYCDESPERSSAYAIQMLDPALLTDEPDEAFRSVVHEPDVLPTATFRTVPSPLSA